MNRGKRRKAKEGKVVAGPRPNYGFKFNENRDSYLVDEKTMAVIRRIFRMMGAEHRTLYTVKRTFEREGVSTPAGGKYWHAKVIRAYILDNVYKPHTHDEITALVDGGQMSTAVASRFDPNKNYGIWWFNRRRTKRSQVSELSADGKRTYRKRSRYVYRPQKEWVAVPVPNSRVPRQWVDAAREAIKENGTPSNAGPQ